MANDDARLKSLCFRATFAAGAALAVVFLLVLSGAASVTLLYDTINFGNATPGFEGTVLETTKDMRGAIRFVHAYGGYSVFVLAGWAAVEMFALSRALKRSTRPEHRQAAGRILVLGSFGAVFLAASIGVLVVTGVMAAGFNRRQPALGATAEAPKPEGERFTVPEGDQMVNWHTRELTYLVGVAALLVAAAASMSRKAGRAMKELSSESPHDALP